MIFFPSNLNGCLLIKKKTKKKTAESIMVREIRYLTVLEPKRLNTNAVNMKRYEVFFCRCLTKGQRGNLFTVV